MANYKNIQIRGEKGETLSSTGDGSEINPYIPHVQEYNSIDNSPLIRQAINEIYALYGDVVSVQEKKKSLIKFGRNSAISSGVYSTIMNLPSGQTGETYTSTNSIDRISSSDNTDTQVVTVEGHTKDQTTGDLTFVVQNVTLTGQTPATLTTPLARCTRAYNNNTTVFAGNIYFFENGTVTAGVPNTASQIHMTIPAGRGQSQKCATSISSTDYFILTGLYLFVYEKASAYADAYLRWRLVGTTDKAFREISLLSASSGVPSVKKWEPYLTLPSNIDIEMIATHTGGSPINVGGAFHGFLASVV